MRRIVAAMMVGMLGAVNPMMLAAQDAQQQNGNGTFTLKVNANVVSDQCCGSR